MNRSPVVGPVSVGVVGSATRGTSIPHSSSNAGVFPATPTEIVASVDEDAVGFVLNVTPNAASFAALQLKLFAGASSAEQEFAHLLAGLGGVEPFSILCPLPIPKGARVSATSASSAGFQDLFASLTLLRGDSSAPRASRASVVGVVAGGDLTTVDAGATVNTKGAWVELEDSTPRPALGFTLVILQDASSTGDARFLIDVAVGATEQIVLADTCAFFAGFTPNCVALGPIWTPLPQGSRIAARAACNVNNADRRAPRVGLIIWE